MHWALSTSCSLILLFFCKKMFFHHLWAQMLNPTVVSARIVDLGIGFSVPFSCFFFWGNLHRRQGKVREDGKQSLPF